MGQVWHCTPSAASKECDKFKENHAVEVNPGKRRESERMTFRVKFWRGLLPRRSMVHHSGGSYITSASEGSSLDRFPGPGKGSSLDKFPPPGKGNSLDRFSMTGKRFQGSSHSTDGMKKPSVRTLDMLEEERTLGIPGVDSPCYEKQIKENLKNWENPNRETARSRAEVKSEVEATAITGNRT